MKLLVFLLGLPLILGQQLPPKNLADKNERLKQERLAPCRGCAVLVKSFETGMEKTVRGKFEGGDTAYEEEKMGSYKYSEVRLTEITEEFLCKDVIRGMDQCYSLANDYEEAIEEWWKGQTSLPPLHEFLCIDHAKVCCPVDHFGPECQKCPDCHGNGVCKGNGTRKGNGKCNCDVGYHGDDCLACDQGYYESFKDDTKLLCSKCHMACDDQGCKGPGSANCHKCKPGWRHDEDGGCSDVNECFRKQSPCKSKQFCVNTEGSYSCLECDRSCDGCTGDGPDLCLKCAENYELKDGLCTDMTSQYRSNWAKTTRYLVYGGLTVATCIIFQNSPSIAGVIGVAVGLYITFSEYWLNKTNPNAGPTGPQILPEF